MTDGTIVDYFNGQNAGCKSSDSMLKYSLAICTQLKDESPLVLSS